MMQKHKTRGNITKAVDQKTKSPYNTSRKKKSSQADITSSEIEKKEAYAFARGKFPQTQKFLNKKNINHLAPLPLKEFNSFSGTCAFFPKLACFSH